MSIDQIDNEFLWVEKYRPQVIEDCILPDRMKTYFKNMLNDGNLQNMLLVGGPGCGKTTVAKALCNELSLDVIVINASENGNIDMLRNTIRGFASSMSFHSPYKVVILDEADFLNANSTQPSLRNFMEEFSNNCRFILTANYANRIIQPLQSRCAVVEFTFNRQEKGKMAVEFDKRIKEILRDENIEFDAKTLAKLLIKHFPDFRKVLNELQRFTSGGSLDSSIITSLSSDNIKTLFDYLKDPKKWHDMRKWVVDNGDNDTALIIRSIYDRARDHVTPDTLPNLVLILAEYDYKAGFVMDKEINIVACLTEIMSQCSFK